MLIKFFFIVLPSVIFCVFSFEGRRKGEAYHCTAFSDGLRKPTASCFPSLYHEGGGYSRLKQNLNIILAVRRMASIPGTGTVAINRRFVLMMPQTRRDLHRFGRICYNGLGKDKNDVGR